MLSVEQVLATTKRKAIEDVVKYNMFAQNMKDISVLRDAKRLEVISASQNLLNDSCIEVFSSLPKMKELYLRHNVIESIDCLANLSRLRNSLQAIWLDENPVAAHPLYRKFLIRILPNLLKLDQGDVTEADVVEAQEEDSPELSRLLELARRCAEAPSPIRGLGYTAPLRHESITMTGSGRARAEPRLGSHSLEAIRALLRGLDVQDLDYVIKMANDMKDKKGGAAVRPRASSGAGAGVY